MIREKKSLFHLSWTYCLVHPSHEALAQILWRFRSLRLSDLLRKCPCTPGRPCGRRSSPRPVAGHYSNKHTHTHRFNQTFTPRLGVLLRVASVLFLPAHLLSSLVFSCDNLSWSKLTAAVKDLFESNRGSKCFGCLVSTEAHGDDGFQVLFRNALCWRGPSARTAARQHQRCCEICTRPDNNAKSELNGRIFDLLFYFSATVRSVFFQFHLGRPYGSWSSLWQYRFQCSQCNKPLSCKLPAGIPFHINGTQWSHQGLELREQKKKKKRNISMNNVLYFVLLKSCLVLNVCKKAKINLKKSKDSSKIILYSK